RSSQRVLCQVRSYGLIAIDNTLWDGKVVDQSDTSEYITTIRQK
ncbi:unnamed protein product, partial [Rotaria sp. Silwood2]